MENLSVEKEKVRILFLASEPLDAPNIRLGKELQEIRSRIKSKAEFFELSDWQAVRAEDVQQTILNFKPHIVHFSGHGLNSGEICFENDKGESQTIPPEALASLFGLVTDYVKCVIINTCFSEVQAKAISKNVPIVIGTHKEISDNAAIQFSTGFYTALDPDISQKSLKRAFESGCIAIQFDNLAENLTPVIMEGAPEIRFSSEVDSAFLTVKWSEGYAFEALQRGLTLTGIKMGVPEPVVNKILQDKIQKVKNHQDGIREYEMHLKKILMDEYPLSEVSSIALVHLQNGLELTDEEAAQIKNRVLSDPNLNVSEKWYDRGFGQEIIKNLDQAIEYYSNAIRETPEFSGAYYRRGICYDALERIDLAMEDFTKALEINSKWNNNTASKAYYNRARSRDTLKPDDPVKRKELRLLSLSDWTKSLELDATDPEAYFGRGLVLADLGDHEKAIADYKKAYNLSLDTKRKIIFAESIEKSYRVLNNPEEALNWKKIQSMDPNLNLN